MKSVVPNSKGRKFRLLNGVVLNCERIYVFPSTKRTHYVATGHKTSIFGTEPIEHLIILKKNDRAGSLVIRSRRTRKLYLNYQLSKKQSSVNSGSGMLIKLLNSCSMSMTVSMWDKLYGIGSTITFEPMWQLSIWWPLVVRRSVAPVPLSLWNNSMAHWVCAVINLSGECSNWWCDCEFFVYGTVIMSPPHNCISPLMNTYERSWKCECGSVWCNVIVSSNSPHLMTHWWPHWIPHQTHGNAQWSSSRLFGRPYWNDNW